MMPKLVIVKKRKKNGDSFYRKVDFTSLVCPDVRNEDNKIKIMNL